MKEVQEQLTEQNITLQITESARTFLIEEGYDEKYGARPLRRTLQRLVEDPLSVDLLKGRFKQGSTIVVDLKEGKIAFRTKRERKSVAKKDTPQLPQEVAVP